MTAYSPALLSRLGQENKAGSALELFMKEFSGMVMTEFNEVNVFRPLHRVKVINSGESHTFEALGSVGTRYHVPGESILRSDGADIYLQSIGHGRRTILTDPVEISPIFVDDWDEMVNHYPTRKEYARQLGEALSESYDRRLAQVAVLTAREAATVTSTGDGGSTITGDLINGTDSVVAGELVRMAFAAKDLMTNKKVPKTGRYLALPPEMISILIKESESNGILLDKDLSTGNGDVAMATIYRIAGFRIVESTHIPQSNIAEVTGARNTYHADFSDTKGVAFQTQAFGSTQLKGLTTSASYEHEYQGNLLVAKMCVGSAPLRPECAVELADDGV